MLVAEGYVNSKTVSNVVQNSLLGGVLSTYFLSQRAGKLGSFGDSCDSPSWIYVEETKSHQRTGNLGLSNINLPRTGLVFSLLMA